MTMQRAVLRIVLTMALSPGCGVSEKYIRSSPHAEGAEAIKKQRRQDPTVLESPDYQFTVVPFNARFKSGLFMLTLIPFPMDHSGSYDKAIRFDKKSTSPDPPFVVEIGIKATRGAILFDLSMAHLEIEGKKIVPSSVIFMSEKECNSLGHTKVLSSCHSDYIPVVKPLQALTVPGGTTRFVWLLFNTKPPTPETQYSLMMNGIKREGKGAEPVLITFSPEEASSRDSLP